MMSKSAKRSDNRDDYDEKKSLPVVGQYTDKSLVVRGDRLTWHRPLVNLGAKYRMRLRGGNPGWLINKDKLPELEKLFGEKIRVLPQSDVQADQDLPPRTEQRKRNNDRRHETPESSDERNERYDRHERNEKNEKNERNERDKRRNKHDETPESSDERN